MDKTRKLIGVCGVRIFEQNVMPFVQVLKQESEKRDFHLVCFSGSTYSRDETDEVIGQYQLVDLMRQVDICALVILAETIRNEKMIGKLLELGREKNIPVFSLDRKVEGCYNLLMDNKTCFEQIVRHVVEEHGCRNVYMIAGDKGERFSEERISIYRKVLEENHIPFDGEKVGHADYWEKPVAGVMKKFRKSGLPLPEAIICANDIMAHAAITVLNEHGYEVPEDVIVTGYDGVKDGVCYFPSITSGTPDFKKMVERIFEELAKSTESNRVEPCDIIVQVILNKRQSCGCEPKVFPKNDRRIARLLAEIGTEKWHMKAMHHMLGDTLDKRRIEDIIGILPIHMENWFQFYRYVGVKTELFHSYEISEGDWNTTSILEGNRGSYKDTGKKLETSKIHSHIQAVLSDKNVNTVLVHLLNFGKDVYGFSMEGFDELVDWELKEGDEFAMFLSQILHTVIHNFKMNALNRNLQEKNKEIEAMSLHDSMTGVYNRRGFFYTINQIIQNRANIGKYLYLFMTDMDGLKYINDNFGHAEGDFAIVSFARVLTKMGGEETVCARIGGDEFICALVKEDADFYQAGEFCTQLEGMLEKAEGVSDKAYPISASVGLIVEEISSNLDLDAMMNRADDKMYEQKISKKMKRV